MVDSIPLSFMDAYVPSDLEIVGGAVVLFTITTLLRHALCSLFTSKVGRNLFPSEVDVELHGMRLATNITNIIWLGFDVVVTFDGLLLWPTYYWYLSGHQRLYQTIPGMRSFAMFKLAFELLALYEDWDNDWIFKVHHVIASIAALWVAQGYCQAYTLFFMGTASLSTCFLVPMETYRHIPEFKIRFGFLNKIFLALFGVSFLTLRVGFWLFFSARFYADSMEVFKADSVQNNIMFYGTFVINTFLTILQLHWATKILKVAKKVLLAPMIEKKQVKSN
eukprot:Platyproteum_vivax@DN519_c0_g1_i1.p1